MKPNVRLTPQLKFICLYIFATAFSGFSYIETKISNGIHTFSETQDSGSSWGAIETFNRASLALKRTGDTVNYIEAGIVINVERWRNSWYFFDGGLILRLSSGMQNLGPFNWQLHVNSYETFTVGNGLTIKELSSAETGARVSAFGFNLRSAIYGSEMWYYWRDSLQGEIVSRKDFCK
ncbi:MAG: hypothetical protein LBI42_14185 [Chitinispirillales bacterium]|jgi:hypothetical protein|nr:hypothetical protein [Chitinispirillales bacterium]